MPETPSVEATDNRRRFTGRATGRFGGDRLVTIAAVSMIVPVWVAVVRVGLRRLVPVGDTAIMALRAPDVLSRHPPLIGMPASSASGADQIVHFPGALQLYWLAVPVRLLGDTWGTVVAMGALNTIWILAAAWLLRRNLSRGTTLVAYAVLSVFWWSLGSGMLIDSWPLLMVVVPFTLVLVAAWATACGDGRGLVVLAVAANYVWLDHLVLGLLAPAVAAAGVVGHLGWYRRARRDDPDAEGALRRRFGRSVGVAGAVTFLMWLPTLVQQFTGSPGNLGLLLGRSDGAPASVSSVTAAVHVLASLIGRPPFWLRGTLGDPTFYRGDPTGFAVGSVTWLDVAIVAVGVAVFVVAVVVTRRRSDRNGLWVLIVAAVGVAGGAATVYLAPVTTAVVPEYLVSLWAVAMFVWLAVAVVVARQLDARPAPRMIPVAFAVTVAFAVLNLPASRTGYTGHPEDTVVARAMIDTVVPRVAGDGTVGVKMENVWTGNANTLSALQLGLRDGDVAFCYPTPNTSLYDFIADCDGSESSVLVLAERAPDDPPPGEVLFSRAIFPDETGRGVDAMNRRVRAWLAARDHLTLTASAQRPFLGPMIPQLLRSAVEGFEPVDGNLAATTDDPAFWDTIISFHDRSGNRATDLLVDQPIGNDELYRWAVQRRRLDATQWVVRDAG